MWGIDVGAGGPADHAACSALAHAVEGRDRARYLTHARQDGFNGGMKTLAITLAMVCVPALALSTPAASPSPDIRGAFSKLKSTATVAVERDKDGLRLVDSSRNVVLLEVGAEGVQIPAGDVGPPADGQPANTRELRDADGKLLWTISETSRGARSLRVAEGVVGPEALHVLTFDNEDFHASDGLGRLIASAQTEAEGAHIERVGATVGCGCERRVEADGRVTVRPLER